MFKRLLRVVKFIRGDFIVIHLANKVLTVDAGKHSVNDLKRVSSRLVKSL